MQNGRAIGLMDRARERDSQEEPPRIRVKPEDWEV